MTMQICMKIYLFKTKKAEYISAADMAGQKPLLFITGKMWSKIEDADLEFINFAEAYQFILTNKIPVYNISQGSWQKEIKEYERSK